MKILSSFDIIKELKIEKKKKENVQIVKKIDSLIFDLRRGKYDYHKSKLIVPDIALFNELICLNLNEIANKIYFNKFH
jgi:hypothetical protein